MAHKESSFQTLHHAYSCSFSMGIPEGTRNKVMFNGGLYLKRKYPDSWKDKHEELNQKHCIPPLPANEIVGSTKADR